MSILDRSRLDHLPMFGGNLVQRHPAVIEVPLVAIYVAAVAVLAPASIAGTVDGVTRLAAAAAMGLPLLGRRRWPLPVFALTLGLSSVALASGIARDWFVGPALALYEVAGHASRDRAVITRVAIVGTSVLVAGLLLSGSAAPPPAVVGGLANGVVVLGVAWILGWVSRERREYRAAAAAARVEQAVSEERLRIARELHDVVAHGVSLIVVRAATANHVLDRRPEEARAALTMIEATGREALGELRSILSALRDPALPVDPRAPQAPIVDAIDLERLVDAVALAGVHTELDADIPVDLPPLVASTIHRIVQEALTNVVRHAAPARCRVVVRAVDDVVAVRVEDDGAGAGAVSASAGGGHGLIGMRERVRLLGGEFEAGPRRGGGFMVEARLPLSDAGVVGRDGPLADGQLNPGAGA